MSSPTRRQTPRFLKLRKHAHKGFFHARKKKATRKRFSEENFVSWANIPLFKAAKTCTQGLLPHKKKKPHENDLGGLKAKNVVSYTSNLPACKTCGAAASVQLGTSCPPTPPFFQRQTSAHKKPTLNRTSSQDIGELHRSGHGQRERSKSIAVRVAECSANFEKPSFHSALDAASNFGKASIMAWILLQTSQKSEFDARNQILRFQTLFLSGLEISWRKRLRLEAQETSASKPSTELSLRESPEIPESRAESQPENF